MLCFCPRSSHCQPWAAFILGLPGFYCCSCIDADSNINIIILGCC